MPEVGHYIDIAEMRTELGVDATELPDAAAAKLRRNAETLIDQALGPYTVLESGDQQGRKIAEADVAAWRWEAIREATLALAERLHAKPELAGPRYSNVSGPDFSVSGPIGPTYGSTVAALLNRSGLVIRGARARP
jgi:hypothetical protein